MCRCMCGDPGCRSCGPAMGAPSCEWSEFRCGDSECWCAISPKMLDEGSDEAYDGLAEQLADEAEMAEQYRESLALGTHDDPRVYDRDNTR